MLMDWYSYMGIGWHSYMGLGGHGYGYGYWVLGIEDQELRSLGTGLGTGNCGGSGAKPPRKLCDFQRYFYE